MKKEIIEIGGILIILVLVVIMGWWVLENNLTTTDCWNAYRYKYTYKEVDLIRYESKSNGCTYGCEEMYVNAWNSCSTNDWNCDETVEGKFYKSLRKGIEDCVRYCEGMKKQ